KAEKELLESRENWRSVTETSPDHILMLDTDLKIQFVNYTAPGLTIKDVKGKLLYELVDKSDQNRVRKILEGVLKSGEEASYETEYDVPEGSKMYFETRAGVRRLHDQVVGLTVSSRDITQRKQAEEALSISEAFLNNVIEQSPESLWISDDEGTLIRLNQACCDLLGATEEEAVGKYNILKDNVIVEQGFMPLVEDVFKKGEIARFTIDYDLLRVEHVKAGGARHRILDVIISPIKDLYGTVTNVLVLHKDITERKHAEEKVRKSEAFLNQIIEQSPYSIWISDVEGTLIRINPKCCEVLKITEEAVLGKYNIFNDNIVIEQGFLPKVKEAFEEGHVVNFTIKWNAAELKNIDLKSVVDLWIDVTIFPILNESGNLVNAVIQHLDVTERIVAQEMIRKSEETYRTLTENMKEVVFVTDNQGEITFITSSATKMFGYTPEEIIGKRVTALLSEEDIPNGLAAFKNAIESGSGDDGVIFNIKRKDGSTFFGELHSTVSRANGEIIGTQGMVRDVTDRKEAEEALRESAERFRQVAEQAQEWIWEVDRNGLYTYASPVIEKILGYKPEDIVGQKHFYDLFYPDDLKELKKAALQSFAEKESFRGLVNRNVHADGSVVWMDTSGTPILDENGDLLGYRGADTDITQRVQAEKELRELNDTLEAAQKMAKVGYWRFDIESQLPTWSDQMFDVCGYKKEDGVPSYEEHKLTWHSDDWGFFDEAVQACTQGTPYNVVVRIKFRDGTYHFINTQGFPVYDDKGEIKELFGTSQDITELKQAEEVIRQSEVAYRTLTENMRDVIFATDNQGEITFITSSTSDVFGCKPEDMIGRRFTAFLTEEDVPKALAAFRNAIDSSSEDDTLILNMKRKDGTTFYGELRSNVLRINGSITGTQGMIRDITTRKVAEEALIEREESLEEAQEFAKIGSWEMDTDTKKIVWSKQMYRMLEVSPDQEPTFELYFSRVHPDDLEYVQEVGARVYENNEAAIAEYRLLTPSGIIMIVATSGHQILDVENNVIILKGIVQDITERKQAEKELEIQKAYLEELFESAPEAIVILDNEDRIERVNREFTNLFGYLPSEAIDKKINDLVVPEDMKGEGLKATFDARDGKIFALETVRQKKNGERIHVSIIGHPIKIGEEQLAVYGIYRDITNRRKAELALQESMERLKGFDQHSTEGVFRIDMLKPVPVDLSRTETIKWFDEHAVIGEVNDSLARMYGLTPKEMIGRKVVDFAPNSGERAFLVLENDNYRVTNEETEDVDNDGNPIFLIENYHGIVEDGHLHAIWGAQSNITERKRAEAAVIESEDRYRNLIEGSYDLVQSVSPDGKFSIVNKAWLDALGYRKEELEDMSAFDVVHQDSIQHCQEIFERVLKGESVKNFETTFITKNGKMMLLEGKAVPRIKGDKIIGTQSFFRDITDQKRVEQELKQWGHIFKNAQLGIAVSTSDGKKIEMSNPNYEKMVGYTSRELKNLPLSDLFHPEFQKDLRKQISIINKMGHGSFESIIKCKDGSTFPAQIDATAVRDDYGNFMYRVVNLQDITKRKRAEEKLHEYSTSLERMVSDRTAELEKARRHAEDSRDQIDTILKSVSDGLVVTDLENKIVLLNSAAESLLSVNMTEVLGSKIDLAIKNKTLRGRLHGVFGKKISEYEFDFEMPELKNGKKQVFNARTSIIYDRQNFKAGMVTIMQDVTIEREVDRMKTEFVSTAAHELRTPLTSIQGFSEVLITRDDLNIEEKLRFLTYINTQSINLSAIINDLLDVSRIESGKGFELVKQQVDIIRSIREIVNLFKDRSTKHRFKTHLPKREILLLLDNEKILQVFENLLSNATKYSPDGGEIQIKGKVEGDQFKITIKDQGIGMTPDQVGRIYEKFYRADASNTAFEGTGLGMTIVKHIIESHGGTVWAESEINRGTILGIALPMAIR
ncbi:MAG: PAS domain S-box protein, partial [Calditrichaeota bacterium]|nr:PAS domain S-box protein [Calditrichota bacterium]